MKSLAAFLPVLTMSLPSASQPIPLWPADVPGHEVRHAKPETTTNRDIEQNAQGLNRAITYVSVPSLTLYAAPEDRATGAAFVIAPGGGYHHITWDKEGIDVAKRLNDAGLTAAILKYRTRPDDVPRGQDAPYRAAVLEDAKRAMRLVRSRAQAWNIDPDRVGMMGFSAGADLAFRLTAARDDGDPRAEDPVGRFGCGPDALALLYCPSPKGLESEISADWPPLFLVHASDDTTTPLSGALKIHEGYVAAGCSAEMHVFPTGGHGFGLGVRGGAVDQWPALLATWIHTFLPPERGVGE